MKTKEEKQRRRVEKDKGGGQKNLSPLEYGRKERRRAERKKVKGKRGEKQGTSCVFTKLTR